MKSVDVKEIGIISALRTDTSKYGKTLSDAVDDFFIILPVIINKDKIEP